MYTNSTHRQFWVFESVEEVEAHRAKANDAFIERYRQVLSSPEQEKGFLTPAEEALLCRIVMNTGVRFGDDFRPVLWPSIRWIAFTYFKRFYLYQSAMEYYPKNVMMACYYLATKIDEFNISIDNFVSNLRNGNREANVETIIALEPVLVAKLKYHLTVHCPFRPLEGHFIVMKTRCQLKFDLENIRPTCSDFLKKALFSDIMLYYAPSQIALAALQYGLHEAGINIEMIRKYLRIIMEIDTIAPDVEAVLNVERVELQLNNIIKSVLKANEEPLKEGESAALQTKMQNLMQLQTNLDGKISRASNEASETFDSDDDF